MDYTKITMGKCFNCHSESMQKVEIDYEQIKADMDYKYNEGFKDGYKKPKKICEIN